MSGPTFVLPSARPSEIPPEFLSDHLMLRRRTFFDSEARHADSIFRGGIDDNTLSRTIFEKLFDPKSPTIGLSFGGAVPSTFLVAAAVQYQRELGKSSPNVIIIDPACDPSSLHWMEKPTSGAVLAVSGGVMVDRQGKAYTGAFPEPIALGIVDLPKMFSDMNNLIESKGGQVVNGELALQFTSDKSMVPALARALSIRIPPTVVYHILYPARSSEFLRILDSPYGVVTKPTRGGQGDGVTIFNPRTCSYTEGDIYSAINRAASENHWAIVQERAPSYPIFDGGELLDWNFRVLAGKEGIIGIEVRMGSPGGPINKATGARIVTLDDFLQMIPAADRDRMKKAVDRIYEKSIRVAQFCNARFIGLDWIVNFSMEEIFIEVNGNYAGGIFSLAEIAQSESKRYEASSRFLETLATGMEAPTRIGGAVHQLPMVPNSFDCESALAIHHALHSAGAYARAFDLAVRYLHSGDDRENKEEFVSRFIKGDFTDNPQRIVQYVQLAHREGFQALVADIQLIQLIIDHGEMDIACDLARHLASMEFWETEENVIHSGENLEVLLRTGEFSRRIAKLHT